MNEDEAMEDAVEDVDGADSDEGEESGEEDEAGHARKRAENLVRQGQCRARHWRSRQC